MYICICINIHVHAYTCKYMYTFICLSMYIKPPCQAIFLKNGAKFIVSGFLRFLGAFCFFCLSFCHPIGGRDSLKKRMIHQESHLPQISADEVP